MRASDNCYNIAAMKHCLRILIPLLLLLAPARADEQGVIVRRAPVFAEAGTASGSVGQLPAGTRVAVFTRDGGWQEIFSEKPALTSRVRVYQVRAGNYPAPVVTTEQEDSRGFLAGLASFSRKASGFFTRTVFMNTHPPSGDRLDTLATKMDGKLDSYAAGVDNAGRFRQVAAKR
jgi:hypothetical protein